jgi:hypothetical protein
MASGITCKCQKNQVAHSNLVFFDTAGKANTGMAVNAFYLCIYCN